jgi:hypothetical protein
MAFEWTDKQYGEKILPEHINSLAKGIKENEKAIGSIPKPPTKTSELKNDSDFQNSTQVQTIFNEAFAQAKASGEFDGADGITPHIGENGNWFIEDIDTGNPSRGEKGDRGEQGIQGEKGEPGEPGKDGVDGKDGTYQPPAIEEFQGVLITNRVYWADGDLIGQREGFLFPVPVGGPYDSETLTYPEINSSVQNQILLYLEAKKLNAYAWSREDFKFVNDEIPTIGIGCYRVIFEYNPNLEAWVVGVVQDGAVE